MRIERSDHRPGSPFRVLFLLALLAGAIQARDIKPSEATLAVVDALVWTGNPLQPRAQAVAVSGDRILAVGSNDEIRKLLRPATTVIEGNGRTVLPGLIDAHFHILDLPVAEQSVNLRFVVSKEQFADRVARQVAGAEPGAWIFGEGWDARKWGGELPSREWIDRVSPRNPVWLTAHLGAAGLANSAALRALGIDRSANEPPPGAIVRDPKGEPTGLIRGGPMWLVDDFFAERDREKAERNTARLMNELARIGLTSVHHTGSWAELLLLRKMHNSGKLRTRVYAGVQFQHWTRLRDYVAAHGRGDSWLHWGGLKIYQMGWSDKPHTVRDGRLDRYAVEPTADEAYEMFAGATRAGLQIMVHAGGYRVLKMFELVHDREHPKDPRFRIEHAHDIPSDWIALYTKAEVIASAQPPLLAHFDVRTRAGAAPPRHLFPCRELIEAGVKIAFGTDAVTASPLTSPFASIQMALERPGPDGSRITLEECLRAYTRDAAYAEFAETEKGAVEPGKLADLVLLDRDLFAIPVSRLSETKVRCTIIGGEVIFRE
jgi:predicted amidohydrolase YtcJ